MDEVEPHGCRKQKGPTRTKRPTTSTLQERLYSKYHTTQSGHVRLVTRRITKHNAQTESSSGTSVHAIALFPLSSCSLPLIFEPISSLHLNVFERTIRVSLFAKWKRKKKISFLREDEFDPSDARERERERVWKRRREKGCVGVVLERVRLDTWTIVDKKGRGTA